MKHINTLFSHRTDIYSPGRKPYLVVVHIISRRLLYPRPPHPSSKRYFVKAGFTLRDNCTIVTIALVIEVAIIFTGNRCTELEMWFTLRDNFSK